MICDGRARRTRALQYYTVDQHSQIRWVTFELYAANVSLSLLFSSSIFTLFLDARRCRTSRRSTPARSPLRRRPEYSIPALRRRTVAGSRVFHATPRQCFRFSGFGPEAELNPAPFVSTGKNQINRVKYGGSTGAINHQSNHTADLSLS
jgi:hypothetical protein